MAGQDRPKCVICGKYFVYNWSLDKFLPQCKCKGN